MGAFAPCGHAARNGAGGKTHVALTQLFGGAPDNGGMLMAWRRVEAMAQGRVTGNAAEAAARCGKVPRPGFCARGISRHIR